MNRILITGGSGFIGTNLIAALSRSGTYEILNLDKEPPRDIAQSIFWHRADVCDRESLITETEKFQPHFAIHLAARTDLNGELLTDYVANTTGVENFIEALTYANSLKKVLFTSSMYVCRPGYNPSHDKDFDPHTVYGESKVKTEEIIHTSYLDVEWAILRPTSIWGPFFGEPYNTFFNVVLGNRYVSLGGRACKKTYGYIDNTVFQILALLECETGLVHKKVFYLGDYEPYDIEEWAYEIAETSGSKIWNMPFLVYQLAARSGDMLGKIGLRFPMTSFRLSNMTTNNIHDLSAVREIAGELPVSRREGTKNTLLWMKEKTI